MTQLRALGDVILLLLLVYIAIILLGPGVGQLTTGRALEGSDMALLSYLGLALASLAFAARCAQRLIRHMKQVLGRLGA